MKTNKYIPTVYKVIITILLLALSGASFLDVFHNYICSDPSRYSIDIGGGGNLFSVFKYSFGSPFPIIFMVLFFIAVLTCLLMIWLNQTKYSLISIGVILLVFILTLFRNYNITSTDGSGKLWEDPAWGYRFTTVSSPYYLILAIVVLLTIFGILAFVNAKEEKQENNVNKSTEAEELSKFKSLLDEGAITQEEYDKKKKQLLNL